jgi:hypothetical protein
MTPYRIVITVDTTAESYRHADTIARRLLEALGKWSVKAEYRVEEKP